MGAATVGGCDPRHPSPRSPLSISRSATAAVCVFPCARLKRFTSRWPTWSSIGARAPAAANASPPAPSARSRWSRRDARHRCAGHWCWPRGRGGGMGGEARRTGARCRVARARRPSGHAGGEAMVGRWAGLDPRVPARDMESCAQYVLEGIDFDPAAIYLQFGAGIAPGGYAWVFPKSPGVANVGLGLVALKADGRNARQYLDDWIARRYPRGEKTGCTVGGVIVHTTIRQTYTDGVLVAGAAAHMINPLSGGGIVNAMKAGRLAGRVATAAIRAGDTSASRLSAFHAGWMELLGDDHLKYYRLKRALEGLDDAFFNSLARTANAILPEQRTLGRIFAHALVRHPQLIPVAARFFL